MIIYGYSQFFWLFLAIKDYFTLNYFCPLLFHPKLFLAILNNYNIWLLVVLLLMLLMVINAY